MLEAFAVGGVFRIADEASPVLRAISEKLTGINTKMREAQALMDKLKIGPAFEGSISAAGKALDGLVERVKAIGGEVGGSLSEIDSKVSLQIEDMSKKMATAVSLGIKGIDEQANASVLAIGRLKGEMAGLSLRTETAAAAAGGNAMLGARAAGASAAAGRSHGGGGSGIHTRQHVELLPGVHGGITGDAMGPAIGAGVAGFGAFEILKHGFELQHVQQQMVQGGVPAEEIDKATIAAWQEAQKYGLDVSKVLGDIKELRFPFGGTEHAVKFIDPLEQMRVVLNSVAEGKGTESANSVYEMARAGELKGLQDPAQYMSYFDQMTKAISATGGKVNPKSFMQATQYGRMASFGWDEEFYTKYLPTLIQTMNPSTAGTSLMSLYGTLVQGKVTKRSLGNMEDLGLIQDYSKIIYDKKGDPVGFNPGAIKGTDELIKNPLAFAKDVLTPLIEKKYGDISVDANKNKAIEDLSGLFGNRMSAQAIAELALRTKSFDRDSGLIKDAKGLSGAGDLLQNDPTASINSFEHAWSNLLTSLGKPSVGVAIEALNGITSGINAATAFFVAHPDAAKGVVGALTAIAGVLGIYTAGLLLPFLAGGGFILSMTAIAGVFGAFVAMKWDALGLSIDNAKRNIQEIKDAITDIVNFFQNIADKVTGALGRLTHGSPDQAPETFREKAWRMQHPGQDLPPGLRHNSAYTTFDNDNVMGGGTVETIAQGVFQGLKLYASNPGGMGDMGTGSGSGGFLKASYGAGGGGFSRGGGGGSWNASGSGGVPTTFDKTLPPEARALLDTIAGGESPGYNVMNGGARFSDFSQHPGHRAAGRYQDLPSTWRGIVAATGLKDFSPNSQDLGNWWLAKRDYHASTGRDLLTDLQAGDLANVARGLRGTWPSLPGGSQQNTGGDVFLNRWKNNLSKEMGANALPGAPTLDKYMSAGGVITDADMARYNRDRAAYLAKTAPTVTAPPPPPRRGPIEPSDIQAMNMPTEHHITLKLGEKVLTKAVVKQLASSGRFPKGTGGPDTHSFYSNAPGTPITDAA